VSVTYTFLAFVSAKSPLVKGTGLNVHDNVTASGSYGITGTNLTPGTLAMEGFFEAPTFAGNVIEKTIVRTVAYPAGNFLLTPATLGGLLDSQGRYLGIEVGTDGLKPGADVDVIRQKIPWLVWP